MDANVNPDDVARPGPIDPQTGQPDHGAEVTAVKSWLRENAFSLITTAVFIALVFIYLDPIDTAKVVLGLGLVIFIHELGHFLAAKWCDVHVRTFSIGFGPAVPFCSYKWGETTYMVGIIPLGGYVSMVGEGDNANDEEGEEDPRSFKHKTVGQRMLIISAGVVMNIFLGIGCFMAAYLHGVRETPATLGAVESGGAAWRAGVRADSDVKQINSRANPVFNDLRPIVMSTKKGETVALKIEHHGVESQIDVEPRRDEGSYYPQLGISSPFKLTLLSRKKGIGPVRIGTPAAEAKDPGFEKGDRIVGMSDPDKYPEITPIPIDPRDPDKKQPDYTVYHKRMILLADKPITFHVVRKDAPEGATPVSITVEPSYRADLGMRMQMGEILAVRKGGPAEKAGIVARNTESNPPTPGDKIAAVAVTYPAGKKSGKKTWFANGKRPDEAKPDDAVEPLDPILLPLELTRWASYNPADKKVELIVLRDVEHTAKRVSLTLDFDDSFRFDQEALNFPNSPLPVSGLGLAYYVQTVVNDVVPGGPAAAAGIQANDIITDVRLKSLDANKNVKPENWADLKPHQWAFAEASFQSRPPFEVDLKIKRGEETKEVTVKAILDKSWPTDERGLLFDSDFRTQKAGDVADALNLGARRTVRFVREVYLNLYSMIFGRVSAKTMSGPLTIATVSYRFAGEDFWQFLLFLGMISVNLAVVNFLPIPVLDGGHMVFLILEKILGRPVPEKFFAIAMYTGLALILSLMVFVLILDVQRLF